MHLEKASEKEPAVVSQVRPLPAFDLRQVGLADGLADLLFHGAHDLLLRHLSPESA
jgi:hypothetical protein